MKPYFVCTVSLKNDNLLRVYGLVYSMQFDLGCCYGLPDIISQYFLLFNRHLRHCGKCMTPFMFSQGFFFTKLYPVLYAVHVKCINMVCKFKMILALYVLLTIS